jgi:ADP-ribosyl-[dinitrogen reductase] hydrolase
MIPLNTSDRFRGCLLGLAVGDAVGTTVEFQPRGSFPPVVDMTGGGPFDLLPGQWTDDTSMALCLGTSLVEKGAFDPADQMERYWNWYRHGYFSSTGKLFDIGITTRRALDDYRNTGNPFSGSTHPRSAGNGSLMRLAPVPMFFFANHERAVYFSGESSRTTHGAAECIDACRLFGDMLCRALAGEDKDDILFGSEAGIVTSDSIQRIARGEYRQKTIDEIKGGGYVVESLEAALWCFLTTETYQEAILAAVNLGDDADTTAAICGQIAGAYYGEMGIPGTWRERVTLHEFILDLADQLFRAACAAGS